MSEHDTTAPALPVDAGEGRFLDQQFRAYLADWCKMGGGPYQYPFLMTREQGLALLALLAAAPQPPGVSLAPDALAALKAYNEYAAIPQDRGGKSGPKGKAWANFIALKDAVIAKAETVKVGASEDQMRAALEHVLVSHRAQLPSYTIRTIEAALSAPTPEPSRHGVEAMREALKPFASFADPTRKVPRGMPVTVGSRIARRQLTMGDCYDAADALGQHQSPGQTSGGA